jgi:hypothetical protein
MHISHNYMFIIQFTQAHHSTWSWAIQLHSHTLAPCSVTSFSVLSTHICLVIQSNLIPLAFLNEALYAFGISYIHAICLTHLMHGDLNLQDCQIKVYFGASWTGDFVPRFCQHLSVKRKYSTPPVFLTYKLTFIMRKYKILDTMVVWAGSWI